MGEWEMREDNLRKEIVWVKTYSDEEVEEIARAREKLLEKEEVKFIVSTRGFNSQFYLLSDSTEFIIAKEMGIHIILEEYNEDEAININRIGFILEEYVDFADEKGNVKVGDLLDRFIWVGDTYKIEAELIKS